MLQLDLEFSIIHTHFILQYLQMVYFQSPLVQWKAFLITQVQMV